MTSLPAIFAASLGPWRAYADAVADVALRAGVGLDALEASARGGDGKCAGGRMMIERLSAPVARTLLAQLPVPQQPIDALMQVADSTPIIVGWDTARPQPVAKVYLNLSDAGLTIRQQVAAQLGVARVPHVVGRNVAHGVVETKHYQQLDALPEEGPAQLRLWAGQMPLAGVVQSSDLGEGGSLVPRALFVAPRAAAQGDGAGLPRHETDVRDHLHRLPGWDDAAFNAAIPFAWQQVRSVGFGQDGRSWVVYVKPVGRAPALWSLEPAVCIACPHGELGIYVAPLAQSPRYYVKTAAHALSYRVRAGAPDSHDIAVALTWAASVVASAESETISDTSIAPDWSAAARPLPQGFYVATR